MKKVYSSAFKAQVVLELLKEEKSLAQRSSEHGVHANVLSDWKQTAVQGLASRFERRDSSALAAVQHQQQRDALHTEIGKLTTQRNFLEKKAASLSVAKRQQLVERENGDVPVSWQAALLSLARSTLYYQPKPSSAREVAIKHRIDELYFPSIGLADAARTWTRI